MNFPFLARKESNSLCKQVGCRNIHHAIDKFISGMERLRIIDKMDKACMITSTE